MLGVSRLLLIAGQRRSTCSRQNLSGIVQSFIVQAVTRCLHEAIVAAIGRATDRATDRRDDRLV